MTELKTLDETLLPLDCERLIDALESIIARLEAIVSLKPKPEYVQQIARLKAELLTAERFRDFVQQG